MIFDGRVTTDVKESATVIKDISVHIDSRAQQYINKLIKYGGDTDSTFSVRD